MRIGRELLFARPRQAIVQYIDDEELVPGSVLCKTVLSAISHGTEMNMWQGSSARFNIGWDNELRMYSARMPPKTYPIRPGYETVAVVEDTAQDVTRVQVGDLVWLDRPHRDWHVVPETEAQSYKLPPRMRPEQGVFVALTRVALTAVHDSGTRLGESAVVVGLGAVGLLTAQIARLAGCHPVVGIDPRPSRRRVAAEYGFKVFDAQPQDEVMRIRRSLTAGGGPGADVVFEASGTYDGLALAARLAAVAGTIVAISTYTGQAAALDLGEEFHRNRLTFMASMSHNGCPSRSGPSWSFSRLMQTGIRLLADNTVDGSSMITHRLPLGAAPEAYNLIGADPEVIKIAFTYDDRA